ncbi:MAG: hypothetical protein ABI912_12525 [Actinomycetota bacterium]
MHLAWVAGFWDGEGCVSTLKRYATPQFTLTQAGAEGERLCRRVLEWSGIEGRVHGPYVDLRSRTPHYKVRITGYTKVKQLHDRCRPWLSETKNAQAERCFERFAAYRVDHKVNAWKNRPNCLQGHVYDEKNLALNARGHKRCRRCHADSEKRRRLRRSQPDRSSAPLGSPAALVADSASGARRKFRAGAVRAVGGEGFEPS